MHSHCALLPVGDKRTGVEFSPRYLFDVHPPHFMRDDVPRIPQVYFSPNHHPLTPIQFNQTRPSSENPSPVNCLPPFSKTNFLLSPFHTHQQNFKNSRSPFTCVYTLLHSFNPPPTPSNLLQNYHTPFKLLCISLVG